MFTDKYSDRTDVNTIISLFEQGAIRNPETDKTIFCINCSDNEHSIDNPPVIVSTFISIEDVHEVLCEIEDGYFSFVGQSKKEVLNNLSNRYLTGEIMSINMYNGAFLESFPEYYI